MSLTLESLLYTARDSQQKDRCDLFINKSVDLFSEKPGRVLLPGKAMHFLIDLFIAGSYIRTSHQLLRFHQHATNRVANRCNEQGVSLHEQTQIACVSSKRH